MPKSSSKSRRSRRTKSGKSKNIYFLKNISNQTFGLLANGVKGVGNLGSGAVRLSGRVVGVGTGAANQVLGASRRVVNKVSKRARKSIRRKK